MEVLISRGSELCWPEGHPSPTEIPRWPTLLGLPILDKYLHGPLCQLYRISSPLPLKDATSTDPQLGYLHTMAQTLGSSDNLHHIPLGKEKDSGIEREEG